MPYWGLPTTGSPPELTRTYSAGIGLRPVKTVKVAELSRIPVVVVSGMNDIYRHAAWLEADGYVQKPIPVETLLETLQRYCD